MQVVYASKALTGPGPEQPQGFTFNGAPVVQVVEFVVRWRVRALRLCQRASVTWWRSSGPRREWQQVWPVRCDVPAVCEGNPRVRATGNDSGSHGSAGMAGKEAGGGPPSPASMDLPT